MANLHCHKNTENGEKMCRYLAALSSPISPTSGIKTKTRKRKSSQSFPCLALVSDAVFGTFSSVRVIRFSLETFYPFVSLLPKKQKKNFAKYLTNTKNCCQCENENLNFPEASAFTDIVRFSWKLNENFRRELSVRIEKLFAFHQCQQVS